jgi:hypothetical protein
MLARKLIVAEDWKVMDEIRVLRNDFVHARPTEARKRFRFRGFPLLTQRSLRRLLLDVELILRKVRQQSGRTSDWMTVPWGYAAEVGWPQEYVEALEPSEKRKSP